VRSNIIKGLGLSIKRDDINLNWVKVGKLMVDYDKD
jgi:hypothetical protein